MALEADRRLLRTFAFRVSLRKSAEAESGFAPAGGAPGGEALGDGGFQECSGLELEMDVTELVEGGRNDGVIRRVGRAKLQNITLKRGMFYDEGGRVNRDLWNWLQQILAGARPVARYDGVIEVLDGSAGQAPLATWQFDRGLPSKISGPQLNAKTGEIAVEELVIAHEGLRLVANA